MTNERMQEIETKTWEYLENNYRYLKKNNGHTDYFEDEAYVSYDDEISEKTLAEIFKTESPSETLEEKLFDWFREEIDEEEYKMFLEVLEEVFNNDLDEKEEDYLRDYLHDIFCVNIPEDHFLRQNVYINIQLDTGDGNYDFCLNSDVSPCWYGGDNHRFHPKASLVWLAKQQGYTKTQLQNACKEGDLRDPKGFLESVRQELANLPSAMATVIFLVKMTLDQAIELNELIKLQDRNGHNYDATQNPECGYIVLDKSVMCGLFNEWEGGGSVLEIELEKDVRIPIKYIWKAMPDGSARYDVGNVYGMCASAWTKALKVMKGPSQKQLAS